MTYFNRIKDVRITTMLAAMIFSIIFIDCAQKENNFTEELNKEDIVKLKLDRINISLMVSEVHHSFENNDIISIDLNPDGRNAKQFSIGKLKSTIKKDKYTESFDFKNGSKLDYYIFENGGGSGGTEYELEGILEFGHELFLITATDQREFEKGDPEFCLKYLSTIEMLKD